MPLSKEEMQATYTRLGDESWRQIFDGKFQQFGNLVFDQGLHGGNIEPGYLASVQKGMAWVSETLGERTTVESYKKLHSILCQHFKGAANATLMTSAHTGRFRNEGNPISTIGDLDALYGENGAKANEDMVYLDLLRSIKKFGREFNIRDQNDLSFSMAYLIWLLDMSGTAKLLPEVKKVITEINEIMGGNGIDDLSFFLENKNKSDQEKLDAINKYLDTHTHDGLFKYLNEKIDQAIKELDSMSEVRNAAKQKLKNEAERLGKKIGLEPLIELTEYPGQKYYVKIGYLINKPHLIEQGVQNAFDIFYTTINAIERHGDNAIMPDMKLEAIAELYHTLEWLHPFHDGQGRTDLVLLSKILTEHGFHPVIMDDPYYSTSHTVKETTEYLKKGLESWESRVSLAETAKNERKA